MTWDCRNGQMDDPGPFAYPQGGLGEIEQPYQGLTHGTHDDARHGKKMD